MSKKIAKICLAALAKKELKPKKEYFRILVSKLTTYQLKFKKNSKTNQRLPKNY